MAQFHFVEDYERHVAALLEQHPIDEAMSLAVGGLYDVLDNDGLRQTPARPGPYLGTDRAVSGTQWQTQPVRRGRPASFGRATSGA